MNEQQNPSPAPMLSTKSLMVVGVVLFVAFATLASFTKSAIGDILTVTQGVTQEEEPQDERGSGVSDPLVTVVPTNPELKETDPMIGKKSAPVILYAYEDFTCSHCRTMEPVLADVAEKFPDDVKIVWKDAPDEHNDIAVLAHEAARCAEDQGKFWEYHDVLFAHQLSLSREEFSKLAQEVKLNVNQFDQCLDKREHKELIQEAMIHAGRLQLSGTPYFFVGTYEFAGTATLEEFTQAIQASLPKNSE